MTVVNANLFFDRDGHFKKFVAFMSCLQDDLMEASMRDVVKLFGEDMPMINIYFSN